MCRSHLRSNQKLFNLENSLVNTFKEHYVSPKRENIKINKIKRDPEITEIVKTIYGFRSQVCEIRLDTPSKKDQFQLVLILKVLVFPTMDQM